MISPSAAADRHPADANRGRGGGGPPLEVAPHGVDVEQHLLEVPGDGHLVHGMDDAALLDPLPDRALRVVAGDEVDPEPDEVGDVEAALHLAEDLVRRRRPAGEAKVPGADGGAAAHAAP